MSTLLEKQIQVKRTVTTSTEQARAIEDPARSKIIDLLYQKSLTAEQIAAQLKRSGYSKALTTVRHHLDILKESGLIEVVKIEEKRGAISKYYGTTTKLLGYNAPEDFDIKYSSAIEQVHRRLDDILKAIAPKATPKSKKLQDDPAYTQFVMMEIMNRAMTKVFESSPVPAKKKV